MSHFGWDRLNAVFGHCIFKFEGDASRFDVRLIKEVIVASMSIIRGCFPRGTPIDNAFKYITDRIVYKVILTPEGHLFEVNKGLPSGNT